MARSLNQRVITESQSSPQEVCDQKNDGTNNHEVLSLLSLEK